MREVTVRKLRRTHVRLRKLRKRLVHVHLCAHKLSDRLSASPQYACATRFRWVRRNSPECHLFANGVAERAKHGRGSPYTKPPTHGQENRRLKYFWKHLQETY
ncbi:hypothetical protein DPMN_137497 [Dreissena polymorpha]|uniref:Uncharacterized protein n=1 Tax=Dreissena polymorpha TaxID=45954 RepID=A0A9D4JGG3_DREPO|nr:hypothetical protein DPMN_137497 [Dreissena polymorpha]